MADVLDFIEMLGQADTVDDIHSICAEMCGEFGFEHFLYGARVPSSYNKPHFIYISGYPTEWRERYNAQGYMGLDPTVAHCATNITPIAWNGVKPEKNSHSWQFMDEAKQFGLNSGISLPIHSTQGDFAMFNLSSSKDDADMQKQMAHAVPFAQLFTSHLHENVRRLFAGEILPLAKAQLSNREKECLMWAADGKTAWETSEILGVSERTVIFHIQNAAEKLNVVNRTQAVARAISLGLISPQLKEPHMC